MTEKHCNCEIEHAKEDIVLSTRDKIALDVLRLLIKTARVDYILANKIDISILINKSLIIADEFLKERRIKP